MASFPVRPNDFTEGALKANKIINNHNEARRGG